MPKTTTKPNKTTVAPQGAKNTDKIIAGQTFPKERALYNLTDAVVEKCIFRGEEDGESALKETRNVTVKDCEFVLRYPLWHAHDFVVTNSVFCEPSRAPLWYDVNGTLNGCTIQSVKPLRECDDMTVTNCEITSTEVGWNCRNLTMENCRVVTDYFVMGTKGLTVSNLTLNGKYSFQYVENATLNNCVLKTKDAFWHAKNMTVTDCVVEGEYLGWYAENLTFVNCRIIGTQPLCYCKGLKLINCTMEGCDYSFEYSQVDADVKGKILSVKNVAEGKVIADGYGEIIRKDSIVELNGEILTRNK